MDQAKIFEEISKKIEKSIDNCFDIGILNMYPEFNENFFNLLISIKANFAIQYNLYQTYEEFHDITNNYFIDHEDIVYRTYEKIYAYIITWDNDIMNIKHIDLEHDYSYNIYNNKEKIKLIKLMAEI